MTCPFKEEKKPNGLAQTAYKGTKATSFSMVLSLSAYLYFFVVLVWLAVWLMPASFLPAIVMDVVPYGTLDMAKDGGSTVKSIVMNTILMLSFGIVHSILARPRVKELMRIPTNIERPLFVLQSSVLLHCMMKYWTRFDLDGDGSPSDLWDYQDNKIATHVIMGSYLVLGFLNLFGSTLAIDHFELFGLKQGFGIDFNALLGLAAAKKYQDPQVDLVVPSSSSSSKNNVVHGKRKAVGDHIVMRWQYKYVAHPIMASWFFMFWSTPTMSAPRLLFASFMSMYIVVAVRYFEEPDLEKTKGKSYSQYLQTVPRFFPGMAPAK